MKNAVNVHGINFAINKHGDVIFQTGMFSGKRFMNKQSFIEMTASYIQIRTRNGLALAPKDNNRCDEEVYPA